MVITGEESFKQACVMACYCCCCGVGLNRTRVRLELKIKGTYCNDCLLAWFCPCCSMVREWREVKMRKEEEKEVEIPDVQV